MNYDEMVKAMKDEHKKFAEVGKQYRALKESTIAYMDRALKDACKKGVITKYSCLSGEYYIVATKNPETTCMLSSCDKGVLCRPAWFNPNCNYTIPSGNLETVLTRLRKMDDSVLEDNLRRLYKFLKEYSE